MITAEERAAMAAADAEIEAEFRITQEDLNRSLELDHEARLQSLDPDKRKIAEYKKDYYEANREKIAEYQKAYYAANREKVAAQKKAYREANREKVREYYRRYMREYRAKKKAAEGAGTPTTARET